MQGAELSQAWNYYNEWIEEPGSYIFVCVHPLKPYDATFFANVSADWTQILGHVVNMSSKIPDASASGPRRPPTSYWFRPPDARKVSGDERIPSTMWVDYSLA